MSQFGFFSSIREKFSETISKPTFHIGARKAQFAGYIAAKAFILTALGWTAGIASEEFKFPESAKNLSPMVIPAVISFLWRYVEYQSAKNKYIPQHQTDTERAPLNSSPQDRSENAVKNLRNNPLGTSGIMGSAMSTAILPVLAAAGVGPILNEFNLSISTSGIVKPLIFSAFSSLFTTIMSIRDQMAENRVNKTCEATHDAQFEPNMVVSDAERRQFGSQRR